MGFLNRLCIVQEIGLGLELIYASGCYLFVFFKSNFFMFLSVAEVSRSSEKL